MKTDTSAEICDAVAQAARARRLLVFCGAGVSMLPPSKSPSWWEIYAAATKAMGQRFQEEFAELATTFDIDKLLAQLQTQQLADLIVSRFAGETFVEILKVVDVADANENHMLLVALAAMGCIRGIVTTNFDTLLERTGALREVAFDVSAPGIVARYGASTRVPLIKIHGSAVDAIHLIETSSHKARDIRPELVAAWGPLLPDSDLLVIGYSGADLNFGAAGRFFEDFLTSGGRVWWLYRPGSVPSIPDRFARRTTFIEGGLPDFLRVVAATLGAEPFLTPRTGRDAQRALDAAMDQWSRKMHIGKWAAATFFYTLAKMGGEKDHPLIIALTEVAKQTAKRLEPGNPLPLEDFGAAGFLSAVGMRLIQSMDFENASMLLRTAVNIFTNLDHALAEVGDLKSADERHMNLSSSWSNYAQTLLFKGDKAAMMRAFSESLQHAYLGGNTASFLIALFNILQYGFGLEDVRRGLRLVEAGVALADRTGGVQSSIELRLLAAAYHLNRNELWSATLALDEAERRATALSLPVKGREISILRGALLFKQGKVQEGLTTVAQAAAAAPGTAYLSWPIEMVGRYLVSIGIPQNSPFSIDLPLDSIPEIVRRAEAEISRSDAEKTLPWRGGHCRVSASNQVDEESLRKLFFMGSCEFAAMPDDAIALGLNLGMEMLKKGYFQEAVWSAENVAVHPSAGPVQRGHAYGLSAEAYASLGALETATLALNLAAQNFAEAGMPVPPAIADFGTWHSLQCDEPALGAFWAGRLAEDLSALPEYRTLFPELAIKIDSWGPRMAVAGQAFRRAARAGGIDLPENPAPVAQPYPFRRHVRTSADLHSTAVEAVDTELGKIRQALERGDFEGGLALLQTLLKQHDAIPDHQRGIAIALQVQLMSRTTGPEQLHRQLVAQRRALLAQMSFSSLARLETAFVWSCLQGEQPSLAAEVLERSSFVADFVDDPLAKVSLRFWESQIARLRGHPPAGDSHTHFGEIGAYYYETPETWFLDQIKIANSPETENPQAKDLESAQRRFLEVAHSNSDAQAMNAALANAIKIHRRAKALTPKLLAMWRGERANRALRMNAYPEAIREYRKTALIFRATGDQSLEFNSLVGEARAYSRSGHYAQAVRILEHAVPRADGLPIVANLLLALGTAHLLEAHRRPQGDTSLHDLAAAKYQEAIRAAPLESSERALARLALARVLGEKGLQVEALATLDQAITELAHLGWSYAKVLIENRQSFEDRQWQQISLS